MNRGDLIVIAMVAVSLCCRAQNVAPVGDGQANSPPSQPLSAPVSPSAPAVPPDTYIIGATDALNVTVWKEPGISGGLLVRPDGMISMPLLGDVHAAGLTPLQLGSEIETRLKKFLQSPTVTVEITGIHSKVIYLLGEVGRKGPMDMTPGMTLLQAISTAGGLTDYANVKKIYILRINSGKQEKISVHYKEALKGNSSLNLVLQPGDTLVVP